MFPVNFPFNQSIDNWILDGFMVINGVTFGTPRLDLLGPHHPIFLGKLIMVDSSTCGPFDSDVVC